MKILLVDDDILTRRVLQESLARAGHECIVAGDGEAAWTTFLTMQPQVVISDWVMPTMDGLELCRRVRGYSGAYTYFIILSSLTDKDSVLRGMLAGADDYLRKPPEFADLQVKLIVAARIVSLHQRLTEQKAVLERLNTVLSTEMRRDPLTQLGNRLRLREDFDMLSRRVESEGLIYSIAMSDIDLFKNYNDRCGHVAGDDALRAVSAAMAAQVRPSDLVYRYGGEEFLVIMPGEGLEGAMRTADRLRAAVECLGIINPGKEPPGPLTLSVGVAELAPGDQLRPKDVLARADAALYSAKQRGRNCVVVAGA